MTTAILATPIALRLPRIADMIHERLAWKGQAVEPGGLHRRPGAPCVFYHQPPNVACWFYLSDHGNSISVTIIGAVDDRGEVPRFQRDFNTHLSDLQIAHMSVTGFSREETTTTQEEV